MYYWWIIHMMKSFYIFKSTYKTLWRICPVKVKIQHSICGQHLVRSWQDALSLFEWGPSSDRESCKSLQNELLVSSRVLFWHGKKLRSRFNRLFRLGVVHLEDVVDNESQRLSEFEDVQMWLIMNLKGCRNLKMPIPKEREREIEPKWM